jgi:cation transport regulator ChaC
MPGRYPQIDTVQFRRKLDNPKRNILLAAGHGNITKGFENLLAIYQHLHSIGYRADNPLDQIALVTIESASKQAAPMKINLL